MQISESVIRLDLPNSSDHTKGDPITAKKIKNKSHAIRAQTNFV